MSTIKEVILSKINIAEDGTVTPNRTAEEAKKISNAESILEKEYTENKDFADYTSVSLTDLADAGEKKEQEDAVDPGLIGHTDAIRIKDKVFSVVTAKTATEVLNSLEEGTYMSISFSIEVSKADSGSIEMGTRNFRPNGIRLPRARKSTRLEGNMIVIEPNINGFKVSTFIEELDDKNYNRLVALNNWIEDYQGALLEGVLNELVAMGVPTEVLAKAQSALGIIPKARRLYESKKSREGDPSDADYGVITEDIRKASGAFATTLNDELDLNPLTNTTIEFGLMVSTIQITKDSATIKEWKSGRSNLSYFKKGACSGRISRLVGSRRKIPVTQNSVKKVMDQLEELIPCVLNVFENIARSQLGINELPPITLPKSIKNNTANINELFHLDPMITYNFQQDYLNKAVKKLNEEITLDETRKIRSIFELFAGKKKKEEESDS